MKKALINLAEMAAMYLEVQYLLWRHRGHETFQPSCSTCQIGYIAAEHERARCYPTTPSWKYVTGTSLLKNNHKVN